MLATKLSALSIGLIGCSLLTLSLQTVTCNGAILDQRLQEDLARYHAFTGSIEATRKAGSDVELIRNSLILAGYCGLIPSVD